eukprot:2497516-Ditylum_brightwellii.AAC.1
MPCHEEKCERVCNVLGRGASSSEERDAENCCIVSHGGGNSIGCAVCTRHDVCQTAAGVDGVAGEIAHDP